MASLAEANTYFDQRLGTELWDSAMDPQKEKALKQAERTLETHPYWKRFCQSSSSGKVDEAIYEQALFLITNQAEIAKRGALQAQGVQSFSLTGFSETFDKKKGPAVSLEAEAIIKAGTKRVRNLV